MGVGVLGGLFNLGVGGAGPAEGNVVADRVVEQQGFLGHDRHVGPQVAGGDLPDIGAANENRSFIRVVETKQEVGEAGFA